MSFMDDFFIQAEEDLENERLDNEDDSVITEEEISARAQHLYELAIDRAHDTFKDRMND